MKGVTSPPAHTPSDLPSLPSEVGGITFGDDTEMHNSHPSFDKPLCPQGASYRNNRSVVNARGAKGDACGISQIMLELRILFEEQHDRLAKRMEVTMFEVEEHMVQRFRTEFSPMQMFSDDIRPQISGGSRTADASVEIYETIEGDVRIHPTTESSIWNIHEAENDDLYKEAQRASAMAMATSTESSPHEPEPQNAWRRALRRMLSSIKFEVFIGAMILMNSVFLGFELDYMVVNRLDTKPAILSITNYTFTIIFTLEIVLRIIGEGSQFAYNPSKRLWNWIDSCLVLFSLIESGVEIYQATGHKLEGLDGLDSIRAIRIFRLTRILRIFRVARIVRFLRALRTLIYSIMCTLKALVWAVLLLVIIIYVFALIFTQATTDHLMQVGYPTKCSSTDPIVGEYLCILDLYWGSMSSSGATLFKSIVGGISWDIVSQPLRRISPIWEIIFFAYISFTTLAVLNVVTGVFCQSAIEGAQNEHDLLVQQQMANREKHIKKIKELFNDIDKDGSGIITLNELTAHIDDREVQACFEAMELNTSDAWSLFKLLDDDNTHEIDVEEFVDGVLRLRGVAKSVDLAQLMHETRGMVKNFAHLASYIESQMAQLRESRERSARPSVRRLS